MKITRASKAKLDALCEAAMLYGYYRQEYAGSRERDRAFKAYKATYKAMYDYILKVQTAAKGK